LNALSKTSGHLNQTLVPDEQDIVPSFDQSGHEG